MAKIMNTLGDLADAGLLPRKAAASLVPVANKYAVGVSEHVAGLMDRGDADDPIARQFIPSAAELDVTADERADPIGDAAHSPVPGIVHRHRDRVLFKLTHICPVYCRFCFRREMVGPDGDGALNGAQIDAALVYIAAHPEIWEVIMTGGDPFVLSPRRISEISNALAAIAHVKIIRWHTRVPVVEPERIDDDLIAALTVPGATTFIALHANHPRELESPPARTAIARLVDAGIPLVSQSVLLRGVNDNIETLIALMRGFVGLRVKPYYLHHADLAPGTSHFRVPLNEGHALMRELRGRVSGLCVPEYMLDIPGGYAKARISDSDVEIGEDGTRVRDHDGRWHIYPPKE